MKLLRKIFFGTALALAAVGGVVAAVDHSKSKKALEEGSSDETTDTTVVDAESVTEVSSEEVSTETETVEQ